jgi:PKD repeat protein
MQTTKLPGKKTSRLLPVFFGIILLVALVALSLPVSAGQSNTVIISANIVSKPSADFTADLMDGIAPLLVKFSDSSTESPTAWNWSFGDGSFSEEQNPEHIFADGIFTIRLNASNLGGYSIKEKEDYIRSYHSENNLLLNTPGLYATGSSILFNTATFTANQPGGSYIVSGHDLIIYYPPDSPFITLTIHFTSTVVDNPQITGTFTSAILETRIFEGSKYKFKIYFKTLPNPWPAQIVTVNTIEDADDTTREKFQTYASAHGLILLNTSYVLFVTPHIDPSYISSVELTVWVNRSWTDIDGISSVRVMRIDSAGSTSLLSTSFIMSDGPDYNFTATSPNGFSTFGITAVRSSSPPPPPPPVAFSGGSSDSGDGGSDTYYAIIGGSGTSESGTGGTGTGGTGTGGTGGTGTGGTGGNQASETHDLTGAGSSVTTGTTGQQDFTIHPDDAKSAGVTGIEVTDKSVKIEQPGFTINIVAENVREGKDEKGNNVIIGENVKSINLATTPQEATISGVGPVSTTIEAGLSSLPDGAKITTTISDQIPPDVQSAFKEAALDAGLGVPTVAYTMSVTKEVIGTTLPATITMTVPSSWVAEHGGVGAIQIMRIGDDGKPEVLLTNFIGEQVENGIMTFTGYSTKGLSIFGMVSAKATAIKQQEGPGVTIQPITNAAMFTDIGMFSWLLTIMTANPIILVIIIALIAVTLYFGVWRRRLL